jgi:hypothetical protein
VQLTATPSGGVVQVNSKTGEAIVTLSAVDYGYGEVGVLYMLWILVTMWAGMVQ